MPARSSVSTAPSTETSTRSGRSGARQSASRSPKELVKSGATSAPFTRTDQASMRCMAQSTANSLSLSVNCAGGGS